MSADFVPARYCQSGVARADGDFYSWVVAMGDWVMIPYHRGVASVVAAAVFPRRI
jgi:hypothetical protein